MAYVYDFDIASVFFFGLTIFFYVNQKRLRNLQDSIFTVMLACSMLAVVFDFAAVAMERYATAHPVWLLYAVNMLFIFGMQTCLPLFFLYSVASAGKFNKFHKKARLICVIPYAVTMALLFLSPFVDFGICFIDAAHIYRHGPTHFVLYINMGVYVCAGLAVLLYNVRTIKRVQRNVILIFGAILFVAMALQLALPNYLLTASATALALTSVFYALQSPIDQVNPLTGAFSRTLMPSLTQDFIERGKPYTLLLFSIRSFDEFVRLYGNAMGDTLLRAYSEALIRHFKDSLVVYMDTMEFTVVHTGVLSADAAREIEREAPKTVALDGIGTVKLEICMGAVPSAENDLVIVDYMFREMRTNCSEKLYADAAYRRAAISSLGLEASVGRLFEEGGASLSVSCITDGEGAPVADEAQLCAGAEKHISFAQFRQAVGRSGLAGEYYRALFLAMADKKGKYSANYRLCVAALPAAFIREDAAERLLKLAALYGFSADMLLFSVGESDIAASESTLADNIRALAGAGVAFMVDTFAEGYTDMSLIISLPLKYARLHESFTQNARTSEADAKLLRGLAGVLKDVGICVVGTGR